MYEEVGSSMGPFANRDFDNLAGEDIAKYPVAKLNEDLHRITEENPCKKILNFRNQIFAHKGLDNNFESAVYEDLFQAFLEIEKVMKRLNLFLRGTPFDLIPTP